MTYPEALQYLNSFINYEKNSFFPYKESFKLKRIKEFLDTIDNPQDSFKSIHIAGTKGKGSVCAFLAYILKESGFKVGLYTSPHLSDVRERIRILNLKASNLKPQALRKQKDNDFEGMIPKHDLINLVKNLKPKIDEYSKNCPHGALSFFEVYTTLAFEYFRDKKVDFAVLETGVGGRLDATNVVSPLCCGITSLSYDHMDKLGNTLTKIAREKVGIIKKSPSHQVILRQAQDTSPKDTECRRSAKSPGKRLFVVTAPQDKEALAVIRNKAKQQNARLYEIGKDISFKKIKSHLPWQQFRTYGILGNLEDLRIRLLGSHQLINATEALGIILGLRKLYAVKISDKCLREGLYKTFWPARFEIFPKPALIVLDGAHNVDSIMILKDNLKEVFPDKSVILILGISQDKDIKGMCKEIVPIASKLILTRADSSRAASPEEILLYVKNYKEDKDIDVVFNIKEALELALKGAKTDNIIVVTGSLFLVAEARDLLKGKFGK
jgi:dihydrofolate synthase/folylpolyglutamate synthase